MSETANDMAYFKDRAEREIALAKATGAANAWASADFRTVFIERRDGTQEKVQLKRNSTKH